MLSIAPWERSSEQPQAVLLFAHSAQGLALSEALAQMGGAVPIAMTELPRQCNDSTRSQTVHARP